MINNSVVGFMIRPDAFRPCLETWRVFVKVCNYTATTHRIGRGTIVFATATVGSVGRDSRGLVNTAATILMFVAMLSSLACAREPFKTELIFGDLHGVFIWCAHQDLNLGPMDYESTALTN